MRNYFKFGPVVQEMWFKDIYYCPMEIIKGLTDKGQLQYLTNLKGPQEGNKTNSTNLYPPPPDKGLF